MDTETTLNVHHKYYTSATDLTPLLYHMPATLQTKGVKCLHVNRAGERHGTGFAAKLVFLHGNLRTLNLEKAPSRRGAWGTLRQCKRRLGGT